MVTELLVYTRLTRKRNNCIKLDIIQYMHRKQCENNFLTERKEIRKKKQISNGK